MDFEALKKKANSLQELTKKMDADKGGHKDERFWKLSRNKDGVGYATIRFLPAPDGEDMPWVKYFSHSIKGNGYFIENCPTTIGLKCPVCDNNNKLYKGNQAEKDMTKGRFRKKNFISNIFIVDDPEQPENNGKVFLFAYGPAIYAMIENAMKPEFPTDTPVNPFDFWAGANFKIKICKKTDTEFLTYDKSSFDAPSPLLGGDDEKLKDVWAKEYKLNQFISPSEFKTYEQLNKRFEDVIGAYDLSKPKSALNAKIDDEIPDYDEVEAKASAPVLAKEEIENISDAGSEPDEYDNLFN